MHTTKRRIDMSVAGFTNGEEEEVELTLLVPFLVEGELLARKAA
jgi:hypothetical protein